MKLKGWDKFREKTPMLAGKKIFFLLFYIIFIMSTTMINLLLIDNLPRIIPIGSALSALSVLFPILGVFLMECLGLLLVYQMWSRRDRLKAKYGQLSYQKIYLVGFAGIFMVISIAIHNVISIQVWNAPFWNQAPFSFFTTSLTSFIPSASGLLLLIRMLLGVLSVLFGFSLIIRSLFTFGADYMVVLYVYFPEESELQEHKIYSILRHPTYAGLIHISLGGMILQLNLYSIIFFAFYYLLFYVHIHYIEEKELLTRFGESYQTYRTNTRAFFVKIRDIGTLLGFLLGKN